MTAEPRAALSRELADFLIQLSIAIHRYAMYPEGHPSLAPTVNGLIDRLTTLLQERGTLSLGVARTQLVIEGVATEANNPVLKELAGRLHRHHLGAITFTRGVGFEEVEQVLALIAVDADRSEAPVGLNPRHHLGAWTHVRLYPLTYERLELMDESPDAAPTGEEEEETRSARTRAAQLWVGLARAAMAADQTGTPDQARKPDDTVPDPGTVARAIQTHRVDAAYDQVIVGYMLQIADELKSGQTPESGALKKRVSRLVATLDQPTLRRLLAMGGDRGQRHRFLLSASEGMAVDAVLGLVQAASGDEQRTISESMLRMLEKLAKHAGSARGQRRRIADANMREQVMTLVQDWSLADPNPEEYRKALQSIAGSAPVFSVTAEPQYQPEPRRIVEMALEIDTMGEAVWRAVETLDQAGELPWLLETIGATRARTVPEAIWSRLATPERLRVLLETDPVDVPALDHLLGRFGLRAAGPMLDAVTVSESRQTRRLLLDRLIALGGAIGPEVVARIDDERWYVVRNMLTLLAELPTLPAGFDAFTCMDHADPRVRREALRILLRDEHTRDRAVCVGLADADDRAVRLALTAAGRRCPPAALPLVVSRAVTGTNTDQRVVAIRILGSAGGAAALGALLQIAAPRKGLFGTKLPPKSPEYLAALEGLRALGNNPRARAALAAAARSRDPQIARAAIE